MISDLPPGILDPSGRSQQSRYKSHPDDRHIGNNSLTSFASEEQRLGSTRPLDAESTRQLFDFFRETMVHSTHQNSDHHLIEESNPQSQQRRRNSSPFANTIPMNNRSENMPVSLTRPQSLKHSYLNDSHEDILPVSNVISENKEEPGEIDMDTVPDRRLLSAPRKSQLIRETSEAKWSLEDLDAMTEDMKDALTYLRKQHGGNEKDFTIEQRKIHDEFLKKKLKKRSEIPTTPTSPPTITENVHLISRKPKFNGMTSSESNSENDSDKTNTLTPTPTPMDNE